MRRGEGEKQKVRRLEDEKVRRGMGEGEKGKGRRWEGWKIRR